MIRLNNLDENERKRIARLEQIKDITKMIIWFGRLDEISVDTDIMEEPYYIEIKDLEIIKEFILMYFYIPYQYRTDGEIYALADFIKIYNELFPDNKTISYLKKHLKIDRFQDYESKYNYGLCIILYNSDYILYDKCLEKSI